MEPVGRKDGTLNEAERKTMKCPSQVGDTGLGELGCGQMHGIY